VIIFHTKTIPQIIFSVSLMFSPNQSFYFMKTAKIPVYGNIALSV